MSELNLIDTLQTPLNSRKFKPTPSTQAEMRDCSEHLSVRRLAKVSCAPNLLDFGSVCINSTTRKTFSVVNNLRQHVRVALCIENEELIHSTPEAQVIPPSKARWTYSCCIRRTTTLINCRINVCCRPPGLTLFCVRLSYRTCESW